MRYFVVFFFFITSFLHLNAQEINPQTISGNIISADTKMAVPGANIINLNKVVGTQTSNLGYFEIKATVNDTLLISLLGFNSLSIRVTNDWVKNKTTTIQLTEKAIALEEVVIIPYKLTGYLEVDSKLIPINENYRYSISGLPQGYEAGQYSPGAFSKVLGSIFNPADALYNFFGNKNKELRKLKTMKKDDTVRNLLASKFDRETIAILLGISKNEIPEILARCNYSESFIRTANDLQIMDAINDCYEEYKILKK